MTAGEVLVITISVFALAWLIVSRLMGDRK